MVNSKVEGFIRTILLVDNSLFSIIIIIEVIRHHDRMKHL